MRISSGVLMLLCMWMVSTVCNACESPASVCTADKPGSVALIRSGHVVSVFVDVSADPAVQHVANSFAADIGRVGGKAAQVVTNINTVKGELVIIGVVGQSPVIDGLIANGKLDAHDIAGQWETFRRVVVVHPFPDVPRALVIAGSDRRGAVFGTYDISEQMGVSPWYWFADVPVQQHRDLFITPGTYRDSPKVKYRGFFINDEDPSFKTWSIQHFGGVNARMYEHVFELLLRLKANYLWPAMWGKAFNDDDPQNMILADRMGIVMGTSHHEPMTRAQDEWHRNTDKGITGGKWDYTTNADNLRAFWRGGIERMMSKGNGQAYDSLVTVGMRGDGDEAMTEGTATNLLETIVTDQRHIIEEVTGKPASQTPQVWALYKEVQDYYDHGMKVPDDVTLLFADDNWGQIRRLPVGHLDRSGGYGVYYHFDYVGAPRNYKWLNTNQIEKVWQQMDLAYSRGARTLWIVNVGDIKPMEFPISFFMKQAWNPEAMTPSALKHYPEDWARTIFGASQAAAIADLITRYGKFAARRKPELVDADSFMIGDVKDDALDGGEFGLLVDDWKNLEQDMLKVKSKLPRDQLAAYMQLVEYPVSAMSNLYQLYYDVAWNRKLAASKDSRANFFADATESAFHRDQALADSYHQVSNGKWSGMMLQTHIGYQGWQQPDKQVMPVVKRIESSSNPKPVRFVMTPGMMKTTDVVAIEAPEFSRSFNGRGLTWQVIPNLGRTEGAVISYPQGTAATTYQDGIHLEYDLPVTKTGDLTVQLYLAPTLDTTGKGSLHMGVSIDDRAMITLIDKLLPAPNATTLYEQRDWNNAVSDNVRILQTIIPDVAAGKHVIKIWRLDDNVVLQKIVASTQPIPLTYLGPPAIRNEKHQ